MDFEHNYRFYIVYYTSLKGYRAGNFNRNFLVIKNILKNTI
jgi:hypothetical protein